MKTWSWKPSLHIFLPINYSPTRRELSQCSAIITGHRVDKTSASVITDIVLVRIYLVITKCHCIILSTLKSSMHWKFYIPNPKYLLKFLNKRGICFLYFKRRFPFLGCICKLCRFSIKYVCLDNFILAKNNNNKKSL